ncbi:16S rRNA (cytidine(1402)-2'-O)-methyltransferase [bacterium]|nr:16S rRNA (cytidine(1402)-2'-O)-methyltransferase [bacterium]
MRQFGNFYIVATPIGNLEDISARAIRVLKDVDLVLAEDTRETAKILQKYNISTPQLSYRDQNHVKVLSKVLETLQNGQNIALTSDSGTPLISDPGFKLVQELIRQNVDIFCIPGPTAVISALAVSGLPTDKFTFLGFLPKGKAKRQKILQEYAKLDSTLVIYESPYKIEGILEEIRECLEDRQVCVANELTKKFEKVYRGNVTQVLEQLKERPVKGECVVLIGKEGFEYGS